MWSGQPANYESLRAFGYPAYAYVNQGKFASRALQSLFIGYPEGVKGYKIWCTNLSPPRCLISRDVVFNEDQLLRKSSDYELTRVIKGYQRNNFLKLNYQIRKTHLKL